MARKKFDRRELLDLAEGSVRKRYKDALIGAAARELETPSVFVSGGSLALDRVCAGRLPGGLPIGPRFGRVVHVPGEWSTGKSVLLDEWFRNTIVDLRGLAYCTEAEGTRDTHFATAIGLPLDMLVIDRPGTLEEGVDHFLEWHDAVRAKDPTVPVLAGLDSLDAAEPERAAKEGLSEGGGWHYGGGKSEALGAGLRKITKRCARYPTTYVILNQTRDNVGVMFGPKKRSSGGNPPHFFASLELWLTLSPLGDVRAPYRGTPLTPALRKRFGFGPSDHGDVVGRWVRAKVTKTKLASTLGRTADFYIDFERGVHRWGGLLQQMIVDGKVTVREDGTYSHRIVDAATGEVQDKEFASGDEWLAWVGQTPEALAT